MYSVLTPTPGAAIARSIGNGSMPVMVFMYMRFTGSHRPFWDGLKREAFQGWREFLNLGIPGMLGLCLEWWAFEALAVLCGLCKDPETAIGANAGKPLTLRLISFTPFQKSCSTEVQLHLWCILASL